MTVSYLSRRSAGGWRRRARLPAAIRLAVIGLGLVLLAPGAYAAAAGPQTTIVVFGDSQAHGVAVALQRVLIENRHYRVLNRSHPGAAIVHDEDEWLEPITRFLERGKAEIAVVMFGANDRLEIRQGGKDIRFRTPQWRQLYAARADEILAALDAAKLKVFWLGNPVARSAVYSADMGYINGILEEEATRYGATFVPLTTIVADPNGHYVAIGPDRDGVTRRLRADDGIHFTEAGYELIAERVLSLLPREMAKAP